jgi:NACalpha-BTF3-like transcription factor
VVAPRLIRYDILKVSEPGKNRHRRAMAGRRARPTDGQVDDVPEKHRKLPDTADDAEEPAEEAEVEEEDEEEEEEGEIEIDEDEDPVELLKAQGVSEDVAKRMLETAEGDVDAAVMLIVEHQELEKGGEGPRESDGGVAAGSRGRIRKKAGARRGA